MNYIAHIQLANVTNTCVVGNFLGDFVKGSDLSKFTASVQEGIRLHRKIDAFTDSHPLVIEFRRRFPRQLRRISGIALDIYFDHLLCCHWQKFNEADLSDVLDDFYHALANIDEPNLARFSRVKSGLLEYKWLANYTQKESCLGAFKQIEKRLNHRIEFAEETLFFLDKNHRVIEQSFLDFYPSLMSESKIIVSKLNLN